MTKEEALFLQLVNVALGGDAPGASPDVDWQKIYALCETHEARAMVFPFVRELCADESLLAKWETAFVGIACQMAELERETKRVTAAFCTGRIRHTLFKGCVLRGYYPYPDMRTMGDVDILVSPEDMEKVYPLMRALGYTRSVDNGYYVHTYKKGAASFEIHRQVFYTSLGKDADTLDFTEHFKDYSKHAIPAGEGEYTYVFAPEYHMVYLVAHMMKHFYSCGFGVRMLADLTVFIRHFQKLNWALVETELQAIGARQFAGFAFALCRRWFGCEAGIFGEMTEEQYELLAENVLTGGIFTSSAPDKLREFYDEKLPLRDAFYQIFPPVSHMAQIYPFVKRHPYLLPVTWVVRFYKVLFIKKRAKNASGFMRTNRMLQLARSRQAVLARKLGLP